jgi:hypothetical protein
MATFNFDARPWQGMTLYALVGMRWACRGALIAACTVIVLWAGDLRAQVPFGTPEAAADALIRAAESKDPIAMPRVLGSDWRALMPPEGIDAVDRLIFVDKARQSREVRVTGARGELAVGTDGWVLPIPLLQGADGQWRFDLQGGRAAIQQRRIAGNERSAAKAAQAYVQAQREYIKLDRNGDGVPEYARKLVSSEGRRDGLIWKATDGGSTSPLGESFLPPKSKQGHHGYRFKILDAQGPQAEGGARSYLDRGRLRDGFALLAWPVGYDRTGVHSFMINQDGKLYRRDLGPQTTDVAARIKRFDPDARWSAVTLP